MARKKSTSAPAAEAPAAASPAASDIAGMTFEPEAQYAVRLRRAVSVNGIVLRPGAAKTVIKGRLAAEIREHIVDAEPA